MSKIDARLFSRFGSEGRHATAICRGGSGSPARRIARAARREICSQPLNSWPAVPARATGGIAAPADGHQTLGCNRSTHFTRHRPREARGQFAQLASGKLAMSVIRDGELYFGVEKHLLQEQAPASVPGPSPSTTIALEPEGEVRHYGQVPARLQEKRSSDRQPLATACIPCPRGRTGNGCPIASTSLRVSPIRKRRPGRKAASERARRWSQWRTDRQSRATDRSNLAVICAHRGIERHALRPVASGASKRPPSPADRLREFANGTGSLCSTALGISSSQGKHVSCDPFHRQRRESGKGCVWRKQYACR